jgi:hypothetical protein
MKNLFEEVGGFYKYRGAKLQTIEKQLFNYEAIFFKILLREMKLLWLTSILYTIMCILIV